MLGVILAAGRGSRLGTLTATRSKAMLPVAGRPLVGWVVDLLLGAGVTNLILVARPEDKKLKAWLSGAIPRAVPTQVVIQPEPLGMGHALSCAALHIGEPFLLAACDNLVRLEHLTDVQDRFAQGDVDAVLSVLPAPPEEIERGAAVVLDGERVLRIVEKPTLETIPSSLASLPLYLFSPRILDQAGRLKPSSRGELELQPAIQALVDEGRRVVAVVTDRRWTVNTPSELTALDQRCRRFREFSPWVEPGKGLRDCGRARLAPCGGT